MNPNLGMKGGLGPCVLLSYASPAEALRPLVPSCFQLVQHRGWAFWNIVLCRITRMRPIWAPAFLGVTYHHVAYRILVEAPLLRGGAVRGLHFLRSDSDSRLMAWGGNWMTDFRFHPAGIRLGDSGASISAEVDSSSGGSARFVGQRSDAFRLPAESCFSSVEESRGLLKYRPLGLSVSGDRTVCRVAQVRRDEGLWRENPLQLESVEGTWEFLDQRVGKSLRLESASVVRPMPYRWQLGRQARLHPAAEGY